jgi:hypothetical protein
MSDFIPMRLGERRSVRRGQTAEDRRLRRIDSDLFYARIAGIKE